MRGWGAAAMMFAVLVAPAFASAAETGTVTFVVRDDRGNDLDAKVTLDDETTPIPLGRQQTLEPGIHDVHWSVASGVSGVQKLTVIEGQQGRIFQIVANVAPPTAPAPLAAAPPIVSETPARSPWPFLLLGAGATLAVTSAVFQLVAINEDSDSNHYFWTSTREDLLPSTREAMRESGRSHYDAAQTDEAIAITCGILAVTAITVAITWLIVGSR